MSKRLFFTDLDNTLIFSKRRELPGDKRPVEWLNGSVQSFMTQRSFDFFTSQCEYEFIPVTTRTVTQFMRLNDLMDSFHCSLALVCNGSVLLRNGVPDTDWLNESRCLASEQLDELLKCHDILARYAPEKTVRSGEELMYYVSSDDPEKLFNIVCSQVNTELISVTRDTRKVYCVPQALSKGSALIRMRRLFPDSIFVSTGDSEADISMLNTADVCIPHPDIRRYIDKKSISADPSLTFSDAVCAALEKL